MFTFWPSTADVLRKAKLQLCQLEFKEMCIKSLNPLTSTLSSANSSASPASLSTALEFLQTRVHSLVDHRDVLESEQFRLLTKWLFKFNGSVWAHLDESSSGIMASGVSTDELDINLGFFFANILTLETTIHSLRTRVYESILVFFPESMKEPIGNLVDKVSFE